MSSTSAVSRGRDVVARLKRGVSLDAGERGRRRDLPSARTDVSRHQRESTPARSFSLEGGNRRLAAAAAADDAGGRRLRAADRLRQSREPDAGARLRRGSARRRSARRSAPIAAGWRGSSSSRARCSSVVGAAAGLLLAVWLVDGIAALAPAGPAELRHAAPRLARARVPGRRHRRRRAAARPVAGVAGIARGSQRGPQGQRPRHLGRRGAGAHAFGARGRGSRAVARPAHRRRADGPQLSQPAAHRRRVSRRTRR